MMSSILASFPGTFARILRRDINAVCNAIDLPWSNGQADGQLNRVKTIKLTMYGWDVSSARELTESF
jgi:transposase